MIRKIQVIFIICLLCSGFTTIYAQSTLKVEVAFEELNELINVQRYLQSTSATG